MTSFMTFSVYSLRISSDMPVESNFVPMVTLYFILGISYTFLSFIWFIIANEFLTKNYLPRYLVLVASVIKSFLSWKSNDVSRKISPVKSKSHKDTTESINKKSDVTVKNKPKQEISYNIEPFEQQFVAISSCEKCEREKEKDDGQKKKKALIESSVSVLNKFICFIMCLIVIACNLITWLLVSNPPPNF